MSKKSIGDKGETLVINVLNNIKAAYLLLNDVIFQLSNNEMTHQIDHILIHPHGVFVIETKNYYGTIIVNEINNSWIKVFNNKQTRISNPLIQNKSHYYIVSRLLKKEVEVIPVVVFVRNNAPYMDDENVINLNDLLLFVNEYPYKKLLSNKDMKDIYNLLKKNIKEINTDEHIENIYYLKESRKELQNEIMYAVEHNICPRCGSKIINSKYFYKCSKCSFKYKL